MKTPAVRLNLIVLDCPDPASLARFYADLLGLEAGPVDEDGWVELSRPGGDHPALAFQPAERYQAPGWPDGVPQQVHLDLAVADLASAHEHAVALGAVPLTDIRYPPKPWRVYADPAGHPFCLCTS